MKKRREVRGKRGKTNAAFSDSKYPQVINAIDSL
jgi:hypothetical protein